jgi:hypothetical protein
MALTGGVVPWEIASRMRPPVLLACRIIAGELEGGEFDWAAMRWRERKKK